MEAVAVTSRTGSPITVLGFLIGDRTLIVGDGAGGVSSWQVVPPPNGGEKRLTRTYQFAPHAASIVAVTASRRDKSFATADQSGSVHISYGTSGQTLLSFTDKRPGPAALVFAPKSDALLTADGQGVVAQWQVHNPHPEVTLKTLFGKIWYEGYSQPAWVWQSTGGTDDFESKMSLTPLIFGTLKGTLYALLFAVPMALLAALYVSEFMHPSVKAYVKPVVEIMAALPSVVLGFLAGLWLAPVLEPIVPGLFLVPLVLPVVILAAYTLWRLVPLHLRARFKIGTGAFLLVPVVLAGIWIALGLGGLVENLLMQGNYRGWVLSALGLTYDQRNSLVVGVAMGFAVIPIIFTIAEDSLANVPGHLRAGSLALGATRWQTALRIVLPTGGALTLAMLLVVGLITLIMWNGMGFFWPRQVTRLTLSDGSVMTGQIVDREPLPGKHNEYRIKVKVANRDLYGADFQWVEESRIVKRDRPTDMAVIERTEWGLLIGSLKEVRDGGKAIAVGGASAWAEFQKRRAETERVRRQIRAIEKVEIGAINARQEALRLKLKGLELKGVTSGPGVEAIQKQLEPLQEKYQELTARLAELRKSQTVMLVVTADGGTEKDIPLAEVLDVRFPNAMGFFSKCVFYLAHVWEFVSGEPREAN